MKLINQAIIYKAELPTAEALATHVNDCLFEPIGETFSFSLGFVPNKATGELVNAIPGGLSFTVRHDEKILPKAAVNRAVDEAIKAAEEERGALDDEERGIIKENVLSELVRNALVKTTVVNAFYDAERKFLIVPAAKRLAGLVVGLLVKAAGSVTTTTIHISDIKNGLTTRLKTHLEREESCEDPSPFGVFKLGDAVLLKEKSNKASFDLDNLDLAKQGLIEALAGGMQVERIQLEHGSLSFKLTKDFHLKGLDFFGDLTPEEEQEREEADFAQLWRIEAGAQTIQVAAAAADLCELLSYKEPEAVGALSPKQESEQ